MAIPEEIEFLYRVLSAIRFNLEDFVLVGGFASYFYQFHDRAKPTGLSSLLTYDIDLASAGKLSLFGWLSPLCLAFLFDINSSYLRILFLIMTSPPWKKGLLWAIIKNHGFHFYFDAIREIHLEVVCQYTQYKPWHHAGVSGREGQKCEDLSFPPGFPALSQEFKSQDRREFAEDYRAVRRRIHGFGLYLRFTPLRRQLHEIKGSVPGTPRISRIAPQ